jgi:hypothetical protein
VSSPRLSTSYVFFTQDRVHPARQAIRCAEPTWPARLAAWTPAIRKLAPGCSRLFRSEITNPAGRQPVVAPGFKPSSLSDLS